MLTISANEARLPEAGLPPTFEQSATSTLITEGGQTTEFQSLFLQNGLGGSQLDISFETAEDGVDGQEQTIGNQGRIKLRILNDLSNLINLSDERDEP